MKIFSRIEKERYLTFDLQLEEFTMIKIKCQIDEIELVGYDDKIIASVSATYSKCQHSTESYGASEESIRRCLAQLKKECPLKNTNNFYVAD